MKYQHNILFVILISCHCLFANSIDKHQTEITLLQTSPIEKVKELNKKSWTYHQQKKDSALFFAKQALELANEQDKTHILFIANIQLAEIYRSKKKLKLAEKYLDEAKEQLEKVSSLKNKGRYYLYKGRLAYNNKQYKLAEQYLTKGLNLQYTSTPALVIDIYMYLSKVAVKNRNYSKASQYLKDAITLAERTKKSKKASLFNNLGNIQARQQQYDKAKEFYEQSLLAAKTYQDTLGQSRAYLNIGNILYYQGNWNNAISWYLKSADLKNALQDQKGIAKIHSNIAAIYKQHKRYEESLRYYERSESYFSSIKDSVKLAETWMNEAILITFLNNPTKALNKLHNALNVFNKNKLLKNQQLAEYNIALAYTKLKDYKTAIKYLKSAKEKAISLKEEHSLIYITNLYGVCYFELKQYAKAISYYQQSYNLSKTIGALHEQKTALFGLYETTEALGDFHKSLQWHKQYSAIKDSLFNTTKNVKLLELQEKYDTKLKEQEIFALKATNEKVTLENTIKKGHLKLSLLGVIIGILTTIVLSLLFYFRNKTQKAELIRTKEKNKEQINQLLQQQEIHTLETILKTQEEERKSIATDIHDNLGSYLATIKYQHEANKPIIAHSEESESFNQMSRLINDTYSEVRSIAHRMATGIGFDFNLIAAIQKSVDRINAIKLIKVKFHDLTNNLHIYHEAELALYKIVQELLSNVLKHSQATELTLQINNDEDYISLILEDNGIGFNPEEEFKGIGLSNISTRITSLNGQIEIDSYKGKGTTTLIRIPSNQKITLEI